MRLHIITPEGVILDQEVEKVSVPGSNGSFTILRNHAPIISTMKAGRIEFTAPDGQQQGRDVNGGVVQVLDNWIKVFI